MIFWKLLRLPLTRHYSISLWERDSSTGTEQQHLEDWYTSNIWAHILDASFLFLDKVILERYVFAFTLIFVCVLIFVDCRKEVTCLSSAARRNRGRDDPDVREKISYRLDALLRAAKNSAYELAALEAARHIRGGETGSLPKSIAKFSATWSSSWAAIEISFGESAWWECQSLDP